ncbi:GGDEF domain-containing protein [Vibrio sp. WJH972]
MLSLLTQGQKVVDRLVARCNCASTNDKLRLNHYIWLIVLSTPITVGFIIKNVLIDNVHIATVSGIFAFCMIVSIIGIIRKLNLTYIYHFNNFLYLLMLFLITVWSDLSQGQILWCYTYPLISIFLFGNRVGVRWSLLLLASILIGVLLDKDIDSAASVNFEIRFAASYLTILLITCWLEYYRARYTEKFNRQNMELINERAYLEQEIARRVDLENKLNQLANEDGLTGLYNRRYFLSSTQGEIVRAKQNNTQLFMALIDLDHFKSINDKYGHPIGDRILKNVAEKCSDYFKAPNLVGRMGGEEFSILMTNISMEDAINALNELRLAISQHTFIFDGIEIKLTISIGLSKLTNKNSTVDLLYSSSDQALYKAKHNGRNRLETANK